MSEFHQQLVNRAALHPSHSPLFVFLFLSIPFGKTVPTDDDLFPPIRPPADVTAPQADDPEEGEDDTAADADADADAATGDGSDASEESDEVSSSVQKIIFAPLFEDEVQDIEFIMEPANRSLDLRCVASSHSSLFPVTPSPSSRPTRPAPRHANSMPQKGSSWLFLSRMRIPYSIVSAQPLLPAHH
jgi:hypothetical protein